MNCCRSFFGYYIFIDNNEIKIFVGPGGIYKRMKIDAIKKINAERYWITLFSDYKEIQLDKRLIKKSDAKIFYDEIVSRTKIEIKFY
ncbi:MAG: hypothetical protein ACYDEE_14980, partial [Ignavibacteriaceae bacterium]